MDIFQYKQFCIHQEHAAMKVGTDSDLLGTLSEGGETILDIGTGTGVLSLMLAQRYPGAHITAIDIDNNAIADASKNFSLSKFKERISLHHIDFQSYNQKTEEGTFDSVVCNPPYFDKSLECDDMSRTRARHSSSLPFKTLIEGAYRLLKDDGVFSVCIPPEVLEDFKMECLMAGFWLKDIYNIKSIPQKAPKRFVLVHKKGRTQTNIHNFCMRNADHTRSEWYKELMKPFLINL